MVFTCDETTAGIILAVIRRIDLVLGRNLWRYHSLAAYPPVTEIRRLTLRARFLIACAYQELLLDLPCGYCSDSALRCLEEARQLNARSVILIADEPVIEFSETRICLLPGSPPLIVNKIGCLITCVCGKQYSLAPR